MSGTVQEVVDPLTHEVVSRSVTQVDPIYGPYVSAVTIFDVHDTEEWSALTRTYEMRPNGMVVLSRTTAFTHMMGDGGERTTERYYIENAENVSVLYHVSRSVRLPGDAGGGKLLYEFDQVLVPNADRPWTLEFQSRSIKYLDAGHSVTDYTSTTTYWDGRVEHAQVFEYVILFSVATHPNGVVVSKNFDWPTGKLDYLYQHSPDGHSVSEDYEPAGRLTFRVERWADGTVISEDFDAMGLLSFRVQQWADGRVTSEDYDDTGLLSFRVQQWADGRVTSEDYDDRGRLSFRSEVGADGRIVATDFDEADIHPWVGYVVAYSASGVVESVGVI